MSDRIFSLKPPFHHYVCMPMDLNHFQKHHLRPPPSFLYTAVVATGLQEWVRLLAPCSPIGIGGEINEGSALLLAKAAERELCGELWVLKQALAGNNYTAGPGENKSNCASAVQPSAPAGTSPGARHITHHLPSVQTSPVLTLKSPGTAAKCSKTTQQHLTGK